VGKIIACLTILLTHLSNKHDEKTIPPVCILVVCVDGVRLCLWTVATNIHFVHSQVIYEYGEPRWNDVDRENRKTQRKTCSSCTLSTTNSTWTDLGLRVTGEQLTAWAMIWPYILVYVLFNEIVWDHLGKGSAVPERLQNTILGTVHFKIRLTI
jgi:hypothetical protein